MIAACLTVTLLAATPTPEGLLEHYVRSAVEAGATEQLALDLLHVEVLAGVPERYRGMTLAKAKMESGFNPYAVGDNGKAIGMFQLWPWAERFITDRTEPIASAHLLLGAIVNSTRTIKRKCPKVRDRWLLAWIRVNRGPTWRRADRRGEPRCSGSVPKGLKVLRRWRRAWLRR